MMRLVQRNWLLRKKVDRLNSVRLHRLAIDNHPIIDAHAKYQSSRQLIIKNPTCLEMKGGSLLNPDNSSYYLLPKAGLSAAPDYSVALGHVFLGQGLIVRSSAEQFSASQWLGRDERGCVRARA
jgi:hypothetical protein